MDFYGPDILGEWRARYTEAWTNWNLVQSKGFSDIRFYAGDQYTQGEVNKINRQKRNMLVINKTKRLIDMISGLQRKNRMSIVCEPQEDADQQTADQFSALLLYILAKGQGYNVISDAFAHSNKSGFALLNCYVDYTRDQADGDIKLSFDEFNQVLLDPYFTRRDLSNCNFVMRRRYISRDQVKALLPNMMDEIDKLPDTWRDEKYTWMTYSRKPTGYNLMAYDEYYRRAFRDQTYVVNQETGEVWEIEDESPEAKRRIKMIKASDGPYKVVNLKKPTVELHIIVNGIYMWGGIEPHGLDDYPFVPLMPFFEPSIDTYQLRVQSLVSFLRDPQREFNNRRSKAVDILDSTIATGIKAKEGALKNPEHAFLTGQGRLLLVNKGYALEDVQQLQPIDVNPGLLQLANEFNKDMMEVLGITEEVLGIASNDSQVAGITVKLRQSAGLVVLQEIFDNLAYAEMLVGQKLIKIIQKAWSPAKIKRILNEEPTQEFYDADFDRYDCQVAEGLLTDTQRMLYYKQLLEAYQLMPDQIPGIEVVRAMPIQGKQKLIEAMDEQAQAIAEQQRQADEDKHLTDQMIIARTAAESARALAETSRQKAQTALEFERISQVEENRAKAQLDRAKAITEIAQLSDARIIEAIRFLEEIKLREKQQNQGENYGQPEISRAIPA